MSIQTLSLRDEDMLAQLWRLQHMAYRLEAKIIGFQDIPPLLDTVETLQNCGETFYGCVDKQDGELLGAVAVMEEERDTLTITRMMVHPNHFRKGIAASLMKHVFEQHPDLSRYIVCTGTLNIAAVNLYMKFGFKPVDAAEIAPGVELTTFHKNKL
ncbi:Ribosomal protein S18 acetylase RimI [Paenibacillus polysaccharolyticus]|uniref:Ribosomal protein S18 acetylase RimI n=1 Tax=Paenibacillus polysaccharolyticus TaxID=582692 RepID=A0A1G5LDR5_9BACL|nr:GNAT family N-acetyltransferase [Paenibacillus polysaccharolyticus]SCZ10438.1 Ribosomal protein S18 acetylase RimI [Paenibacillus polysaccharolyticus]